MSFLQSLFLNWIPLFLFIYLFLWFFGFSKPIDRRIVRLFRITKKTPRPLSSNTDSVRRIIEPPDPEARKNAVAFAEAFLTEESAKLIHDPFEKAQLSEPGHVFDPQKDLEGTTIDDLTANDWSTLILSSIGSDDSVIVLKSESNIVNLIGEGEWDDRVNILFKKIGVAPITPEERQSVIPGYPNNIQWDQIDNGFFGVDDIQHLAEARGRRFLNMLDESDTFYVLCPSKEDTDFWDGKRIGDILISSEF